MAASRDALDRVRSSGHAAVLMASSGGSISTAMGQVLGTALALTIKLNMLIRNNAVTEFAANPKRHRLLSYDVLPHLDAQADSDAGW